MRQANLKLITNNTKFLVFPWVVFLKPCQFHFSRLLETTVYDWQNHYGTIWFWLKLLWLDLGLRSHVYLSANWIRIGSPCGRGCQDRYKQVKVRSKICPSIRHWQKNQAKTVCSGMTHHDSRKRQPCNPVRQRCKFHSILRR